MLILKKKMKIEKCIIKKGSILYRFVNCEPTETKLGMSPKNEKYGRCDKHQRIYYCSRSLSALSIELDGIEKSSGSLIKAEVLEDIVCGCVTDAETHKKLRGRVNGETQKLVHSLVLEKLDYDSETTYEETNNITNAILKKYPEGIAYSSVNGIGAVFGNVLFYASEDNADSCPFENIALTELGFKKIKQLPPEKWQSRSD